MVLVRSVGLVALIMLSVAGCGGDPRTTADLATEFKVVPYTGAVRVFEAYGSRNDVDDTVQIDQTKPLMAVLMDCVGTDDDTDSLDVRVGDVLVSAKCTDLKEATVGSVGAQDVRDGDKITVTASAGVTWSVAIDFYDSSRQE